MTDKLTPEQRKRVAEAATGVQAYIVHHGDNTHVKTQFGLWHPGDYAYEWKALVTWLAKEDSKDRKDEAWGMNFIDAIAINDTDTLERMAYEILEAQDA